jgi:hypothetical protein
MPDWMADLNQRMGGDGAGAKEKAERDARWVGEWSDDLTVAIALREWEKAVTLVEQGFILFSFSFSNHVHILTSQANRTRPRYLC